jgi:hypothetical protein
MMGSRSGGGIACLAPRVRLADKPGDRAGHGLPDEGQLRSHALPARTAPSPRAPSWPREWLRAQVLSSPRSARR